MRRTRELPVCVLLMAAAAAMQGCRESRDCVDNSGRKLPDSYCDTAAHGGGHFVYGGRSGSQVGDEVSGGSVSRGGFGGEGGGEGGGE